MTGETLHRGPFAIVVAGRAGSGKTTFATALARRAGCSLFDLDEITGPLTTAALGLLGKAEHALDEPGPGRELRDARYSSLLAGAAANLAIGRRVIVTGPFTREVADPSAWSDVRARLTRDGATAPGPLVDDGGTPVVLVWIESPDEVVRQRLHARGAARDLLKLERPGERTDEHWRGNEGQRANQGGRARPAVPHIVVDGSLATNAQVERALDELGLRDFDEGAAADGGLVRSEGRVAEGGPSERSAAC